MDLVTFLTARLDEDEQAAQTAGRDAWSNGLPATIYPDPTVFRTVLSAKRNGLRDHVCGSILAADAVHIARHDPARVLAEVAAKRALVRRFHKLTEIGIRYRDGQEENYAACACGWTAPVERPFDEDRVFEEHRWTADHDGGTPEWVLHVLATVYADHPDFDPAWRVAAD